MARFLVQWLSTAIALWVADWILAGIHFSSTTALLVAAIVLGFINATVRPVMTILTLPITIVTLGLFYLVVNGVAFLLAAALVPGFTVDGFWWSVLGALVVGVVSWFIGMVGGTEA